VRVTDRIYAGWRYDWMREYRTKYPVARVSVIDGGVRLEVRMADGRMTREVLRGGDPLFVEAEGSAYEIFHLYVREIRCLRVEGPVTGYEYKVMLCGCDGVRVVPPRTLQAANPFESWCDSADDGVACRADP
jgi:hypothetical protein